jgi:hypothetical protein
LELEIKQDHAVFGKALERQKIAEAFCGIFPLMPLLFSAK